MDYINILTRLVSRKLSEGKADEIVFADRPSVSDKWNEVSWSDFAGHVDALAAALYGEGIEAGQCVAVCSPNRAEALVVDFAAYRLRAVPVSIYSTSSPDQIAYVVNDSMAAIIFCGGQEQYANVRRIHSFHSGLKRIVATDDIVIDSDDNTTVRFSEFLESGRASFEARRAEIDSVTASASPDDVATLIYTSGTTGEPKGAVLTHHCFDEAIRFHDRRFTGFDPAVDTSLCFLPLSHIFEKAWTCYCMHCGTRVYINRDPKDVAEAVRQVSPTFMCSVPRFWEKAYDAITGRLESAPLAKRLAFRVALSVGRSRNLHYVRLGLPVPRFLEWRYRICDRNIFRPIRRAMGVDRGKMFPTAGAPIGDTVNEFFHAIGVNVLVGYGLSETTATVSCYPAAGYRIGSVGTPLDGIDVRIDPATSEVQVKAPTVMRGYWNKPQETAEAFTADGWFRTGDAGRIDDEGNLWITDRIKDLIKTSNGKYIAPQALENLLTEDRFIEQAAVIGEGRKFVTALIVPSFDAIRRYASTRRGLRQTDDISDEALLNLPWVKEYIMKRISRIQYRLARYEWVKRITLLSKQFSMDSGELTNTLKLRRPVINDHYKKEIDDMYADPSNKRP